MKIVLLFCLLCIFNNVIYGYKVLSKDSLEKIAKLSKPETLDIQTGRLLKPFLVERISGTESNEQVREMIIQHFQQLKWNIELDTFTASTPLGEKNFTNVIVTKEPSAQRRFVLAAHFDSMYSPNFKFIGATDSAVPCGILLSVAETLNDYLSSDSDWRMTANNKKPEDTTTLEMIFFDGEEAFKQWSPTDSIYGARHLAARWEQESLTKYHPQTVKQANRLQLLDVLVLLDLIGTPNPKFHNYFRSTSWLYNHLSKLEARLFSYQLLETKSKDGLALIPSLPSGLTEMMFQSGAIGDDHIPFMQRGVNILHLIPFPFPEVWHEESDNADCLDPPTIKNFDILFRAFVCEYLELDPSPHTEL